MEGNVNSGLTNFVLDKVVSYESLNAATRAGGDERFTQVIKDSLPEISQLEVYKPKREGTTTNLYRYNKDGQNFLVKELDFQKVSDTRDQDPDKMWEETIEEYKRAEKYLGEYIPNTAFVRRFSHERKQIEYLVVQDIVEGEQYKAEIKPKYGETIEDIKAQVTLPDGFRHQLEDILAKSWQMFRETGYSLDFDFVLDSVNNRIWVYDTDLQFPYGKMLIDAAYLSKLFGISLPPEVIEKINQFNL